MLSSIDGAENKNRVIILISILILLVPPSCAKYNSNATPQASSTFSQAHPVIEPGPLPRNYQSLILAHLQRSIPNYYDLQRVVFGNCAIHTLPIDRYGLKAGQQVWACEVLFNTPDHPDDPKSMQYHIVYIRNGEIILFK